MPKGLRTHGGQNIKIANLTILSKMLVNNVNTKMGEKFTKFPFECFKLKLNIKRFQLSNNLVKRANNGDYH